MNKNRLLMFCCVLSMIIALHGYFYLHHLTKLKVSSYSGWDVFSKKSQVQIKEIRLVNKSKKQNYEPIQRYILFPMYEHKFIPVSIKTFVSKLILFYTLPYEDKWHLEVSGIYLAPKNTEFSDGPELRLSADGIGLPFNGRTTMGWDEGNIRFFLITVENVNPKIDTMDITWKWNGQNGQQVLKTNFKEQYYNYFEKNRKNLITLTPRKSLWTIFGHFIKVIIPPPQLPLKYMVQDYNG